MLLDDVRFEVDHNESAFGNPGTQLDCVGKTYETDRWNGQVNDGEFSVQLACVGGECAPQGFTPHRLITIRKYYYIGSTRVAMRSGSTRYYLLSDHLGSTTVTLNADGSKYSELRYYPWGEVRYTTPTSTPTGRQYTGQVNDSTVAGGIMYYGARYYDGALGRFISADTIVPDQYDPESYDRYAYVRNNPVNRVDPTGHVDDGPGEVLAESPEEIAAIKAKWHGRNDFTATTSIINTCYICPTVYYIETPGIYLNGGAGVSSGYYEETYTDAGYYNYDQVLVSNGFSPIDTYGMGWTAIPDFLNGFAVFLRDQTNFRSLFMDPEVYGTVWINQDGRGIYVTGVEINNQSFERIRISRVAIDIYNNDNWVSGGLYYPYTDQYYLPANYGIAQANTVSNIFITGSCISDPNSAIITISILSQSGRWGQLTTTIER